MGGLLRGLLTAGKQAGKTVDETAAAAASAGQAVPNSVPGQVAAQVPAPTPTVTGPVPQPTPAGAAGAPAPAGAAPTPAPAPGAPPGAAQAAPQGRPKRPLPPTLVQMQERALARGRAEGRVAEAEGFAMPADEASKLAGAPVDPGLDLARQTSPGAGPRNYNLYQFTTTDEALQTIQELAASRVAQGGMEAPHTWDEVRQEAAGYTYEMLLGRPPPKGGVVTNGRRWNDTEITAAAQLLGGHVERLLELNVLYKNSPELMTAADKLEFRLTATRAVALEEMLSNEAREAARTLNVLKMAKAPRDTASAVRAVDSTLLEMGGDDSLAALSDMLERYKSDPAKMMRAVKAQEKMIGWGDMAREYAINNMFSTVTHARNIGGNLINMSNNMFVEGPVQALIDKVARPLGRSSPAQYDQRYVREVVLRMKAVADGFGEALRLAKDTFLEKPNVLSGSTKVEMGQRGASYNRPAITGANVETLLAKRNGAPVLSMATQGIIDLFGIVARRHTNLLGTMDTFFRALNTRSELYAGIYRNARQTGLSHKASTESVYKGLELPSADEFKTASDRAEELIFAQPLTGPAGDPVRYIGARVNDAVMKHPWFKFMTVPFLKTPTNLASWVYRRTPGVGLVQMDTKLVVHAAWKMMTGDAALIEKGTGAAFSRVMTQQAVGWAAYMFVTDRVNKGKMTGAVTGLERGDATEASRMGLPKNSFILRDENGAKYGQSTGGLDPMFALINVIATFHEMSLYAETEEDADMAHMSAAWVLGKVLLERQFLSGFQTLFSLVDDPNPKGAAKFIGEKLATAIPLAGDLGRLTQTPDERLPEREAGETVVGAAYPTYQPAGLEALKVEDMIGFMELIAETVKNRSPFYNEDRPYRVNGWGTPMKTWGNYIERNISPSYYQPMNPNDVQDRDALMWANGMDHPSLTFTMSYKGIGIDVRDIEVPDKQAGWAWQDYQETVGKARAQAIDALKDLSESADSITDAPGTNRYLLQKALALGTQIGQQQWLQKAYVRDAFALRGIEVTDEMLSPEPARTVPRPLLDDVAEKKTPSGQAGPTFGAQ